MPKIFTLTVLAAALSFGALALVPADQQSSSAAQNLYPSADSEINL